MWAGQRVYGVEKAMLVGIPCSSTGMCVGEDAEGLGVKKWEEQKRAVEELHSVKSTGCASKETEGRDQGIKKKKKKLF